MPPGVQEAALLTSCGVFQYRKAENAGYWTMPKGPSLSESNGVATLEGKLRITGGETAGLVGNDSAYHSDFESALTATVCLKISNYAFSGARVENLNFNQRLPKS